LGWEARRPALVKGAQRLLQTPPSPQFAHCYYYHFANRAMHGIGGSEWDAWETQLVRVLLPRQEQAGSWPTTGDQFGQIGRLMVTSLTVAALQSCGKVEAPAADMSRKLKEGEGTACWDDLASGDIAQLRKAMRLLAGAPGQVVPLLRDWLKAPPEPDAKRLAQLIADLNDDVFDTREAASRGLAEMAEAAEPALRQALKAAGSVEHRRRLEKLLEPLERDSPPRLRQLRAVQVLELAGTAEARQLLQAIADRPGGTALTQAAKEALGRLAQRAAP
jgi:hypothetical protein